MLLHIFQQRTFLKTEFIDPADFESQIGLMVRDTAQGISVGVTQTLK